MTIKHQILKAAINIKLKHEGFKVTINKNLQLCFHNNNNNNNNKHDSKTQSFQLTTNAVLKHYALIVATSMTLLHRFQVKINTILKH
jgi:hypothetical protein